MTEQILPCPACGRDAGCEEVDDDLYQVVCHGTDGTYFCGYHGGYGGDEPSAIAAHNAVSTAVRDHAAALASVAEMEAENERLRAQSADTARRNIALLAERHSLRAENERLRAAGGRLRCILSAHGGHLVTGQSDAIGRWEIAFLAATAPAEEDAP